MNGTYNKRYRFGRLEWPAFIIFIGLLMAACGVKAPPVPPDYTPPAAVKDLGYAIEADGSVVLSWSLSGKERDRGAKVRGAKVYRSKDSLESPACENCPRMFSLIQNLRLEKDNMFFREPLQKGFRYYYKIVMYDESSLESADSNVVTFDYP